MEIILNFTDFILHIDTHLVSITQQYGALTYGVLFFIIFAETGFVVTPFLPGDSLLFAAGALAAVGTLDKFLLFVILSFAAIVGDTINYWLGFLVGPKVFSRRDSRFLNKKHLDRTHQFYEKHGGKTIILARFIPIIRTFAPFVAGIGKMTYLQFLSYNVIGGITWIAIFVFAGFFFGNLPIVRQNFSLIIVAIILISVTPIVIDILKTVWNNSKK
ncbi:MAG: DedA family protein [Patescibacteria group bacterium]